MGKTKRTRCPDVRIEVKELVLPSGVHLRVRKGQLEYFSAWMGKWMPRFTDNTHNPCPAKITLQYAKWLIEQLGYEIED